MAPKPKLTRVERERDTLRGVAQGNKRHVAALVEQLDGAEKQIVQLERERDEERAGYDAANLTLISVRAKLAEVTEERDWERQVVAMLRKNEEIRARVICERNAELEQLRKRLDIAELELHKARMTLRAVAAEPGWQDVSPPQDSPPIPAGDTNKEIQ
jgi:chromosome segregation ATPase